MPYIKTLQKNKSIRAGVYSGWTNPRGMRLIYIPVDTLGSPQTHVQEKRIANDQHSNQGKKGGIHKTHNRMNGTTTFQLTHTTNIERVQ